ncbi:unnamed protein product [Closterium sp. NIES-53]
MAVACSRYPCVQGERARALVCAGREGTGPCVCAWDGYHLFLCSSPTPAPPLAPAPPPVPTTVPALRFIWPPSPLPPLVSHLPTPHSPFPSPSFPPPFFPLPTSPASLVSFLATHWAPMLPAGFTLCLAAAGTPHTFSIPQLCLPCVPILPPHPPVLPASLVSYLALHWAPMLPAGFTLSSLLLDRPIEDRPCHCRLLLQRTGGGARAREDGEEDWGEDGVKDGGQDGGKDRGPDREEVVGEDVGVEDREEGVGPRKRGKEREGGEEESSVSSGVTMRYEWLRRGKGAAEFSAITDAEGEVYTPSFSDVHACLAVRCTPLLHSQPCTPLLLTTPPVAPGPGIPRVHHVSLGGEAVEGGVLTAMVEVGWSSGEPGPCQYSWTRLSPTAQGGTTREEVQRGGEEYSLSLHDVGCVLQLAFTPVSAAGVRGEPASATSPPISAGESGC